MTDPEKFYGPKRYNTYGAYLKEKFGEGVFKICIDAGFTCPNRDGSKGSGGCTYCNNDSFVPEGTDKRKTVTEQLDEGIAYQKKRYGAKKFLAYFQAYSNTYDSSDRLEPLYREALAHPNVVGLSIATRPDCIYDGVLDLIEELAQESYVCVEYGLQSIHDKTLEYINRGHGVKEFHESYIRTRKRSGIEICVHLIHGLPLETREMMLDTVRYVAGLEIDSIKFHQLHVVEKTLMKKPFLRGEFRLLGLSEYLEILAESIELLPRNVLIQRLFGLGPMSILIAPDWGLGKGQFQTLIDRYFEEKNIEQGSKHRFFDGVSRVEEYIRSIESKRFQPESFELLPSF